MFRTTEVLRRHNLAMWLGPIVGAAVVGVSLVRILYGDDGLYVLLASVDLVLSFVFYPFGILQFIFLSLIGEPASADTTQLTPIKVLGLMIAFRRFIDLTLLGRPLRVIKAPPVVWALLFVLSLGLSLLVSRDISAGLPALLTYVQLLVMFFLIIDFVRSDHELKYLLLVFVLGGVVNAGLAIYEFHFENFARAVGIADNANRFGIIQLALLCLILPLMGGTPLRAVSGAVLFAAGPIAYSILLSLSRGTFIAGVGAGLYYFLFLRSGRLLHRAVVAGVVATVLWLAPEAFYERIETIQATLSGVHQGEGSVPLRLSYYQSGIRMGFDHFLTGVGLGQFNQYILSYSNLKNPRGGGAHNMYISVFAEAGGIALITFLGFLATSLVAVRSWRRLGWSGTGFQRGIASSLELGIIAFLLGGLSGALEYSKLLWMFLAFAVSVQDMGVYKKNAKEV